MATPANSINEHTTGVCGFTGTAFTGTPVTQYNVITGGSTSSSLNNVAPSSTAGNPLCSAGSSSQPVFSATPTVTSITISNAPSAGTDGTNKTYVDTAISSVNPSTSVYAATTTNIPGTYTGIGGIGDTFLTTATGSFTLDSTSPPVGSRILFKDQSTTYQNGVYVLTTNGTGITGTLFTRATDYDQPSDINSTGVIAVVNGTVNQLTGWLLNVTVTSVGVDPITYVKYNNAPISVTQYDVLVGGASNSIVSVGPGSSGQILQSGGNAANPAYSTSTYPTTNAANTLLYASSANTMAALATANNGVLITSSSGVPSWLANGTTGQVLTATTGSPPSWISPATSGTVTSVSVVSANGFAGTVATATTTPAITLSTTQTGLLSGNGTAITGTAITQYNVLTGGASNAPNSVDPGATSGVPLISQGSSSQPVFGTAVVAGGGTGNTTFTAYSVICAGTTATGAFQNVSGVGSSGNVLTSNGASALPTWQPAGGGSFAPSVLFGAYGSAQSSVFGDATVYTVLFANKDFDVGNNFSSPTFTAPTTGKYLLNVVVKMSGVSTTMGGVNLSLVTTSSTYGASVGRVTGSTTMSASLSVIALMSASDTATVTVQAVTSDTKTASIVTGHFTYFSGQSIGF